jgi:hypothetical protein
MSVNLSIFKKFKAVVYILKIFFTEWIYQYRLAKSQKYQTNWLVIVSYTNTLYILASGLSHFWKQLEFDYNEIVQHQEKTKKDENNKP